MTAPTRPLPEGAAARPAAVRSSGPAPAGSPASTAQPLTFTLADLTLALRRHWLLVLLLTLAGAAGGFLLAKTITPHYKAEASLISNASLAAISDGTRRDGTPILDPSVTPTIVESIGSPVVLERAIQSLSPELRERLMVESDVRALATPALEEQLLVQFLSQTLQVTNNGRSYVVYVSYSSKDAELSAAVSNAVANAYLGYRSELKSDSYSLILDSLRTELASLKSELQTAERTAQMMREQVRLLATRSEALTGREQERAIEESSGLYARQREAEREAEATAAVYERLLLNQREIQSRLNTPELDVQLFALAPTPLRPSGFNVKPILLALGLAGGFCLGASIALLRNRWMKPARRPRA